MATPILTEKEIRVFLMDKMDLNTLIDGVKFGPEDIEQAIINVVDHFNTMSPPTGYSYVVENFPSRSILMFGVAWWLLKGAAAGEAINQLDYSAAGVTVNDRNKAELFLGLANDYKQEYLELAKNYKITQNIAQCYGVKNSEYRWRAH